jgi:hypothetical protein
MSRLDHELETGSKKLRTKETLCLFIAFFTLTGILGGFVFWTLSDLPRVNDRIIKSFLK